MKACPYCAEQIQDAAVMCKHCGRDLTSPQKTNPPRRTSKATGFILILLVVIVGFGMLGLIVGGGKPPAPQGPSQLGAFSVCKQFVERRLRAPKTAQFPTSSHATIQHTDDNRYEVNAYVDSQNGFGALIRSAFNCEVTYIQATDKWQLENLRIDGK